MIGLLANNIWRIGGEAHGEVLNTFTLQPFINFNLPRAWAISTAPLITSNWSADDDNRWTVPIGVGISKVTHVVEQPLNLELQYYHNVKHPDGPAGTGAPRGGGVVADRGRRGGEEEGNSGGFKEEE